MALDRESAGTVSVEAFQLFRLMGFNSLAEALGVTEGERDEIEYMAGLAMGRALVRRGDLPAGDVQSVMTAFGEFYRKMGLGNFYYQIAEDEAVVMGIHECAGCKGSQPVHRPICFVEAGLTAGVLSEALGSDYGSQEVKCIGGLGDDACEFRLVRR